MNQGQSNPLALPAPSDAAATPAEKKLDLSSGVMQSVKLDALGPMVVNSDGTLSRIANWAQMTDPERERTLRVLSARNKLRLTNEEKKQQALTDAGGAPDSAAESEARLSVMSAGPPPF